MHCPSCELLIKDKLQEELKEAEIQISYKTGILKIKATSIDEEKVAKIIKQCGYRIENEAGKKEQEKKSKLGAWWEFFVITLAVGVVIYLFSQLNLVRFFPDFNQNITFLAALLIGLAASLSTCLAIVGGIVVSISSSLQLETSASAKKTNLFKRSRVQIYFQLGRLGSFFLFGGLLGLIGGKIEYSFGLSSFLTILVALIMFYVGLNIIGLVPSLARLGLYLPKSWGAKILTLKTKTKPYWLVIIGALTFFLPCGFTQAMQIAALASGSFIEGALLMTVFAIGTLPVLFLLGLGSSYAQGNRFLVVKKIIASIIIIFALYSLNLGLTLAGAKHTLNFFNFFPSSKETRQEIKEEDNYQTVQLNINYDFRPREFRVKAGIPVKFVVKAEKVTSCSDEVVIRSLGLSTGKLKNGDQVILEFTPTEKGIIPFSCWMGMITGRFIVE